MTIARIGKPSPQPPDPSTAILEAWGFDHKSRPTSDRYHLGMAVHALMLEGHPDPHAHLMEQVLAYRQSQEGSGRYALSLSKWLKEEMWRLPPETWAKQPQEPASSFQKWDQAKNASMAELGKGWVTNEEVQAWIARQARKDTA